MTTASTTDAIRALRAAGFSDSEIPTMIGIGLAESGLRIDATHTNTNGTVDRGVWQINSVHSQYDAHKLVTDINYNAQAAHDIYKSQGFGAWSTYNSGAWKKTSNVTTSGGLGGSGIDVGPQSVLGGAASAVTGALGLPAGLISSLGTALNALTSADFWKRAGILLGGAVLLILAFVFMFESTDTGRKLTEMAAI